MVQDPRDFRRREIRIKQQPCTRGDVGFVAFIAKSGTNLSRTPVLPDDRIVNRFAGGAIPQNCGLSLIGNAYGADGAVFFRFGETLTGDGEGGVPDILRSCSTCPPAG